VEDLLSLGREACTAKGMGRRSGSCPIRTSTQEKSLSCVHRAPSGMDAARRPNCGS